MKKLLSILASLGLAATASAGVVACGTTQKETPKVDDNAIVFANTESETDENNVASFAIKGIGRNIDLNKQPTISVIPDFPVKWSWNSNLVQAALTNGAAKSDYEFTITFGIKDSDSTVSTTLTIKKDTASKAESTVTWADREAKADQGNNGVSWTFSLPEGESLVDTTLAPKVESTFPTGYVAIKEGSVKINNLTLSMTLNEGMPQGPLVLNVYFALKNGFGYAKADQIYVVKPNATEKESKVNWANAEETIDDNNTITWNVKDDGFGGELDLRKGPKLSLQNNDNGFAIIKNAIWLKESKMLKVQFMDGIKKDDYKFTVSFDALNNFPITYSETLTAKKVKPAKNEIKMVPDKDYVSANPKNSFTPEWHFTGDNLGYDINTTTDKAGDIMNVIDWDGIKIDGKASGILCDWENMTIRFLGAAAPEHNKKGNHSITLEVKLANGFEGTQKVTLHYNLQY